MYFGGLYISSKKTPGPSPYTVVKFNMFFTHLLPCTKKEEYSDQIMGKNKINMMSCNETKRKIAYVDDLIIH
jgi:hypothetical protein